MKPCVPTCVASRPQTISRSPRSTSTCTTRPSRTVRCFPSDSLGSAAGPLATSSMRYLSFVVVPRSAWPARGIVRCSASTRPLGVPAGAASPAAGSPARSSAGSHPTPTSAFSTNGGSARPTETTPTSSTSSHSPRSPLQHGAIVAWPVAVALHIALRWAEREDFGQHRERRLRILGLDPKRYWVASHHPALRAAIYPEVVSLAGLLASRYWLRVAASPGHAGRQCFYSEAARRLNLPDSQPCTGWDPLASWIDRNAPRQFREEQQTKRSARMPQIGWQTGQ